MGKSNQNTNPTPAQDNKKQKQKKDHHLPSKIIIALLVIILLTGAIALPVSNQVNANQVSEIIRTEVVKQLESSINTPPMSELAEQAGVDTGALIDKISEIVADEVIDLVANDWKKLTDDALYDMEARIRDALMQDLMSYVDLKLSNVLNSEENNAAFITNEGDLTGDQFYDGDYYTNISDEYQQYLAELISSIISEQIINTILEQVNERFELTDQKISTLEEYVNSSINDINSILSNQSQQIIALTDQLTEIQSIIPTLATKEEVYECMTKIEGLTQELELYKETVKLELDALRELMAENYDELRALIEKNANDITDLYGKLQEAIADYRASIDNIYNELNEKIDSNNSANNESLENMYNDILSNIEYNMNDLKNQLNKSNTTINNTIENNTENIYDSIDNTTNNILGTVEENKQQAADNLEETDKKLTDSINESNKNQTDNLNEVNNQLTDEINDTKNEINQTINEVTNTTSTIVNNMDSKFTEQQNNITSITEAYLTKLDNKMYQQFNRTELSMTKNFMSLDSKFVLGLNNLTNYTNKYTVAVQQQTNKNVNNWINGSGGNNVTHNYTTGKDYDMSGLQGQLEQYNDLVQKSFDDLQNQISSAMGGNVQYIENPSNVTVSQWQVGYGDICLRPDGLWYVQVGFDKDGNPIYAQPGYPSKDQIPSSIVYDGKTVIVKAEGQKDGIGDLYQDKDGNWYVIVGVDKDGKPIYQIITPEQAVPGTTIQTNQFYFETVVNGQTVRNEAPVQFLNVVDQPSDAGQNRYIEGNAGSTGNLFIDTNTNVWYVRDNNGIRIDIGLKQPSNNAPVYYYVTQDDYGNDYGVYCGENPKYLNIYLEQNIDSNGHVNINSPSINKSYTKTLQDTFTKLDNNIYTNFTAMTANLDNYMKNKLTTQVTTTDKKFTDVINNNNATINANINDIVKKVTNNENDIVSKTNNNITTVRNQTNGGVWNGTTNDFSGVVHATGAQTHNITGVYTAGTGNTPNTIKLTSSVIDDPAQISITAPVVANLPVVTYDNMVPVIDKNGYPVFVNDATNERVKPDSNGNYPEGSRQAYINLIPSVDENGNIKYTEAPVKIDEFGQIVYTGPITYDGETISNTTGKTGTSHFNISDLLNPNNNTQGEEKYGLDGNPRSDFATDLDPLKSSDMPVWPGLDGISIPNVEVPDYDGDIIEATPNNQGDSSLVVKDSEGNPILTGKKPVYIDGTNKIVDENGNDVLYNGKPIYSDGNTRVTDKDGNPVSADFETVNGKPTITKPGAVPDIEVPSFATEAEGKRLYLGSDGKLYDNDGAKDVPRRAVTDANGNVKYYVSASITDEQITDETPKYMDDGTQSLPRIPAVKKDKDDNAVPMYGQPVYEEIPRVDADGNPVYDANGNHIIDKVQKVDMIDRYDKDGNVVGKVESLVWDVYTSDEGNQIDRNPFDMPDWNVEDWAMPSYGNTTVTPGVGTVYDYYDEDAVYKEDVYSDTEVYADNVYDKDGNLIHKKGDAVIIHRKGDKLTTSDAEKHVNVQVDSNKDTIFNVNVLETSYGLYPIDIYPAPTVVIVNKWADTGYDKDGNIIYEKGKEATFADGTTYKQDIYNARGKQIHKTGQSINFVTSETLTPAKDPIHRKGDKITTLTVYPEDGYSLEGERLYVKGGAIVKDSFNKVEGDGFVYTKDIYNQTGKLIHREGSKVNGVGTLSINPENWDHDGYDVNGYPVYKKGQPIGEFSIKSTEYSTYTTTTDKHLNNSDYTMYEWVDEYGQINYSFAYPENLGANVYDKNGNIIGVAGVYYPQTVYDSEHNPLHMQGEKIEDEGQDGKWDRDYFDVNGNLIYKKGTSIKATTTK